MLKLAINNDSEKPLRILLLGAHSDDIEIGCGGTILSLIDGYPDLSITWVVFGGKGSSRSRSFGQRPKFSCSS